ncbi:uncharacterized protein EI97DRAFT_183560 [Westerdykella ornata]|uniref:Uncharacterized protein n=1 Tax=Westerdykella ornata TaxID=318751 RepID=A0A6A6JSU7_WESOR|nr:uncharacterized protein EI97DRAFT_183560 [Westerdykella ornata]KAF2279680.1 hypothetical protein EI97DRAFT_183560 [Westerdykella ornata]
MMSDSDSGLVGLYKPGHIKERNERRNPTRPPAKPIQHPSLIVSLQAPLVKTALLLLLLLYTSPFPWTFCVGLTGKRNTVKMTQREYIAQTARKHSAREESVTQAQQAMQPDCWCPRIDCATLVGIFHNPRNKGKQFFRKAESQSLRKVPAAESR